MLVGLEHEFNVSITSSKVCTHEAIIASAEKQKSVKTRAYFINPKFKKNK